MFARLFAESGLSLDRLRSLLEVGAAGSIVKATGGDPIKQSQYSRQIKELETFFRVKLIERHGKGIRLTDNGRELARISRFFLLGLSNFQRGCFTEDHTFRIGGGATFIQHLLLPVLSQHKALRNSGRFVATIALRDEIERWLQDLTLDFGLVFLGSLPRPLQSKELRALRFRLYVPKTICSSRTIAERVFRSRQLPLVTVSKEFDVASITGFQEYPHRLACDDFLQARTCLEGGRMAAILPDFIAPTVGRFWPIDLPELEAATFQLCLAWNPRLLRLDPHAVQTRDLLVKMLSAPIRRAANGGEMQ